MKKLGVILSCPTVFLRAGSNVGAQKKTLNFRSVPLKWVPLSRRVDGVNDVGGAHENMGMHSSGFISTQRLELRTQMAIVAGEKQGTSLSLFRDMKNLDVTGVATVTCAECCWWSE